MKRMCQATLLITIKSLLLSWLFLFSCSLTAQTKASAVNYNHIFKDNIQTVRLYANNLVLSNPIIELNSSAYLQLSFDDLDGDDKDYLYTIHLCDADWKPTQLAELEYINGFNGERILDYEYSFNTRTQFTHYRLRIPNQNIRWTKAGNYLLRVFLDNENRDPVLVRRFMVVDPTVTVIPKPTRPANVIKLRTHQEFDIEISHPGINIRNPQTELKVYVMQNNQINGMKGSLKPMFIRRELLVYDYQDKVTFQAAKEFRFLDLRSFRYRTPKVEGIEIYDNGYEVYLHPEEKRAFRPYIFNIDINGRYVIENLDRTAQIDRRLEAAQGVQFDNFDEADQLHNLEGDYANVNFAIDSPTELENAKVYLFGAFTDWQLRPFAEMEYNEERRVYEGQLFLKQGYYNYLYAVVYDNKPGVINFSEMEGNWHEAENEYTFLVYYRPFGTRYDRLIATRTFSTR
ncbi:MAG: DUF5103 domain-containing protein [Bacteroidota bacterium]